MPTATVLIRLHVTRPPAMLQAPLLQQQLLSMQASKIKSRVVHPLAQTVVAPYRKLAVLSARGGAQMPF